MSFAAEAKVIEERFNSQWGSTTPIRWDNVDYNPTAGVTYVELQIHQSNTNIVGIGGNSNMHRIRGLISINIYVAINSGTRSGRELGDQAAQIFREQQLTDTDSSTGEDIVVFCLAASVTRLGKVEDWFVHNVTIPFYRNEIF